MMVERGDAAVPVLLARGGNNLLKTLILWLPLLPINAMLTVVQKWILINVFGWVAGSILAGLVLMAVIFLLAYIGWGRSAPQPSRVYWQIGAIWLLLWLALQVYSVQRSAFISWGDLVRHYTFWGGDMGALVALTLVAAPYFAGRISARRVLVGRG